MLINKYKKTCEWCKLSERIKEVDVLKLLEMAGVQLRESTLAKYKEKRATHAKKLGGKEVSPRVKNNKKSTAGYTEPKANHKVKSGGKPVKAAEGKMKTSSTSKYASNVTNKKVAKPKVDKLKTSASKKNIKAPSGKLKSAPVSKYNTK